MDIPHRHAEIRTDELESDQVVYDLVDCFVGDGAFGGNGGWELGVVEGDWRAGLVDGWELAGCGC